MQTENLFSYLDLYFIWKSRRSAATDLGIDAKKPFCQSVFNFVTRMDNAAYG